MNEPFIIGVVVGVTIMTVIEQYLQSRKRSAEIDEQLRKISDDEKTTGHQ